MWAYLHTPQAMETVCRFPFPKGLAAPYISEAVVRFETVADLKDDLKEILFSIFC